MWCKYGRENKRGLCVVKVKKIIFQREGEKMEAKEYSEKVEVDRIRRITGYLTGSVSRWNSAKQSELRDRVKHAGGVKKED